MSEATTPVTLPFLPDEAWATEQPKPEASPAEQIGSIPFLGFNLRVFGEAVAPLFPGKEVCRILGIRGGDRQLQNMPLSECLHYTVYSADGRKSQRRTMLMVTEPGLYRLIFQSRKPQAEEFKQFIFSQVLPSLRRHGQYPPPEQAGLLAIPPQLVRWCPQDADFRALCLRDQVIIAERLAAVAEIECSPHLSLGAKCREVAAARGGKQRGFSTTSIWRFHRKWCANGRNWRALQVGKPPGRTPRLEACCGKQTATREEVPA